MRTINTLVQHLKEERLSLALAESVACGMVADTLSSCKGISEILKGSIVCYAPEVKTKLMGIPQKMIDECTCESMEVTEMLAVNLSKIIPADLHAAVTGLASEGGSESKNKPVGTVFFCVHYRNKTYKLRKLFKGTPREIKKKTCLILFKMILTVTKRKTQKVLKHNHHEK